MNAQPSHPFTVDLGAMAQAVEARVASGEYGSVSEVLIEGLHALDRQERAVERSAAENREILRRKVTEALADPRPSLPQAEVFAHLRARIAALKTR